MIEKSYPWAKRFIEIALKSILELNIEYAVMSRDYDSPWDSKNNQITYSKSFQHIDERLFCSRIVLNSISSFLFSGSMERENKEHRIKKGLRFWKFYRDLKYKHDCKYCDIVLGQDICRFL